jgi:hypothetical protein
MRLDHDLHRSQDGTVHVGRAWRWYATAEGGGKLRYTGPQRRSRSPRRLADGLHQSSDWTLHVDRRWRWHPTASGGGKLRPRLAREVHDGAPP